MKCPLLKITKFAWEFKNFYGSTTTQTTKTKDEFQNCIGSECAWFDEKTKTCKPRS
jgi:hypothetical protein